MVNRRDSVAVSLRPFSLSSKVGGANVALIFAPDPNINTGSEIICRIIYLSSHQTVPRRKFVIMPLQALKYVLKLIFY